MSETYAVRVDRSFDVDIDTMWSLWTQPEHLARWFRPSLDDFGPTLATMDLTPGGAYRIEMVTSSGEARAVSGTIVAVEAPVRLSLTWQWEGAPPASLVEITFTAVETRTAVAIHHTHLASAEEAEQHSHGWAGCLESLARTI